MPHRFQDDKKHKETSVLHRVIHEALDTDHLICFLSCRWVAIKSSHHGVWKRAQTTISPYRSERSPEITQTQIQNHSSSFSISYSKDLFTQESSFTLGLLGLPFFAFISFLLEPLGPSAFLQSSSSSYARKGLVVEPFMSSLKEAVPELGLHRARLRRLGVWKQKR